MNTSTTAPVSTDKAPAAIGPYSQAVIVNDMIFTSGQLPIRVEDGLMPDDVAEQAHASLSNVKVILEAAGSGLKNVVKVTVFIKDMNDFARINEVYAQFFSEPFPARSCVEVARLPKDALVEIEAVATR